MKQRHDDAILIQKGYKNEAWIDHEKFSRGHYKSMEFNL